MDETDQAEIPLAGGDVTDGVVRIGGTVRRPVGPHSPLVHALLRHLHTAWAEPEGTPPGLMKQRAQTHGGGWRRMWDEGVGDVIKRREAWLERHAATLTAALTAP